MAGADTPLKLAEFAARHAQQEGGGAWQLEGPRCLEVKLSSSSVRIKVGAMVAYRGEMKFERAGVGGVKKLIKSALTSESGRATEVRGTGQLYLADKAKEISVLELAGETLFVSSADLLAYSSELDWDIDVIKGAGMVAGGLFTFKLSGHGHVAITTHGDPLVLAVTPDSPVHTDPDATVAWSDGLGVDVKFDTSLKTFTGRASGETYQMRFTGNGFVVVQPYEETAAQPSGA